LKTEVIVYTTISLDGGIDYVDEKIVLSSERDLRRLHYMRSLVDAVMIGANTVLKDNPLLTVRLIDHTGRQPYRVIVDSKLVLNPEFKVFDTSIAPSILITSVDSCRLKDKISLFESKGVEVICTEIIGDMLDLRSALNKLYATHGIRKILVEGGGFLIASLLKQRLIDEIYVSISPLILGLRKVNFINQVFDKPIRLKLMDVSIDHVSGEVVLVYKPLYDVE